MALQVNAFGLSVVGKVRDRNQDTLAVIPSRGIVVVADGMGGAPAGDVASALAVQEVVRGIGSGEGMVGAVQRANRRIRELVAEHPELEGMGTTLTALRLFPKDERFEIAHVGDSRAYRLRDGILSPLTRDHTMVRDLVESGKLPAEEERRHPLGHILSRAVGTEETVEVDRVQGGLEEGDRFLLCSDGLMKVMEDDELEALVREVRPGALDLGAQRFVDEGLQRGAPDNITVALVVVQSR